LTKLDLHDNKFTNNASHEALFRAIRAARSLSYLDLGNCYLDDDGIKKVCHALFATLEHLDLSGNDVTRHGAERIAEYIREHGGNLKILRLEDNFSIGAIGARALIEAFVPNGNVMPNLNHINIGRPPLTEIDLSDISIDDEGVAMLVNLVANHMTELRVLSVSGNPDVTPEGWRSFIDVLRPGAASELTILKIGSQFSSETHVDDDIIIGFADVIATNTCLNVLEFDLGVSTRGWNFIANAFCDKSSIENCCYNSNHTLFQINGTEDCPDDVRSLFRMNFNTNKSEVARRKVLLYHLSDIDSIGLVFGPMAETILPNAISWIGRDRVGLSVMFNLLRSKPSLIPKNTSRGNKRKRKSETLCVINNHSSINRAV
jgi:hypothetical protein